MDEETAERPDLEALAWEAGAEAMRAACLGVALELLDAEGCSPEFRRRMKEGLEGAAP